jgi:hypothetical protein
VGPTSFELGGRCADAGLSPGGSGSDVGCSTCAGEVVATTICYRAISMIAGQTTTSQRLQAMGHWHPDQPR